jgi:phosphatidylserine/phosphatidylglycerophosphate/cardiolipin synthase-like enzyme
MSRLVACVVLVPFPVVAGFSLALLAASPARPPSLTVRARVYFSPNGGCTEAVVAELNRAKKTILVQAYAFTSAPIAKALVDAHKRKVAVSVILDRSAAGERYSVATFLANAGLVPLIDRKHALNHNKVMVIDSQRIITGSFNFTKAAEERNAENLLIISGSSLAQAYQRNHEQHAVHCEAYRSNP